MSNIRVIRENSALVIEGGAESGLMRGFFTRRDTDWSTGSPKQIELPLYVKDGENLIVPDTMERLMNQEIPVDEYRTTFARDLNDHIHDFDLSGFTDSQIENCLDGGFKLREFQVDTIRRFLSKHRACGQIATGAGKTLIIAGLCKMAQMIMNHLTILIVVPSSHLLNETSERLKLYGLEVSRYNVDKREIVYGAVNVTMVQSMINDMENGKIDMKSIGMVIVDEAHHSTAETYFKLVASCTYAIGVYGLSGSLFSKPLEKYRFDDLHSFGFYESRIAALFGECVCNIDYDFLVSQGFLTDCKIYQIETDIKSNKSQNFVKVAPETIESEERLDLLANAIIKAMSLGYSRFMCYTRVKEAGERFLRKLDNLGIKSILAYGGKQNGYLEDGEIKFVEDNALFPKFVDGEYKVLIGTTAVEEGVDIPACDCVVFLAGGQSIRQVLQRAGRGFRLSPGKEYALIIDTYDKGHDMTKKHSNERKKICEVRLKRKVKRIKDLGDLV